MKWHKTKLKSVPGFTSLWANSLLFATEHCFALLDSFPPVCRLQFSLTCIYCNFPRIFQRPMLWWHNCHHWNQSAFSLLIILPTLRSISCISVSSLDSAFCTLKRNKSNLFNSNLYNSNSGIILSFLLVPWQLYTYYITFLFRILG